METVSSADLWSKSKVLVKAGIIGVIVLLLLIPTFYVTNLIEERQVRQQEAITEVSSKWAGAQTFTGPVILVPYRQSYPEAEGKVRVIKRWAYFLPAQLAIQSRLATQEKHRGIYKVLLYNTKLAVSGRFDPVDLASLNISDSDVVWNEVALRIGLTDTKGLDDELKLRWKEKELVFAPAAAELDGKGGLIARLPVQSLADLGAASFDGSVSISGTGQLLFTPVGKVSKISVQSPYPHPSFTGALLPQMSQVTDSGFTASWTGLAHKRPYPQAFREGESPDGKTYNLEAAAVGVDLFVPVNGYQKTLRSVKYAILCILLTFAAFFLMDTSGRKSVHPFQYGLIGLALILFYTLLLSFSEYIGFNPAYAVASLCTIGLIAWFVKGLLASGRLALLLSAIMVLLYGYIFTLLQLQDFSLLMGSIGLFLTLAVIMYFSRKLKW